MHGKKEDTDWKKEHMDGIKEEVCEEIVDIHVNKENLYGKNVDIDGKNEGLHENNYELHGNNEELNDCK